MRAINRSATWASRIPAIPFFVLMCVPVYGQSDAHVGTWELNLQKSSFDPGPPPRRQTLFYKAEGRGLTALLQGVDATGKPIALNPDNLVITFDGRDHPTTRLNYDSSAWTRISPNKYIVYRKRAGKVVLTSENVVSADGKTMTITTKGVGEDGRPINNVRVYEKQ